MIIVTKLDTADIVTVATTPFDDQRPGTSGLRKSVRHFKQEHYLENFLQSIFSTVDGLKGGVLVLGGDGRYHNDVAVQTTLRMAGANGVARVLVGRDGILSTPAMSCVIRKFGTTGGIILSASHNPGGPAGDFGIKFNPENGGPAPEAMTEAFFQRSKVLTAYRTMDTPDIDLTRLGKTAMGSMEVEVIDPVADHADLMEGLFDFDRIRSHIRSGGVRPCFDALHAVTGPYGREIFVKRLGAAEGSVINAVPSPDFGGGHPDPNLVHVKELLTRLARPDGPDFGAASDGDGDRNIILGKRFFVTPSDSLAVLAANAGLVPAYSSGLNGVARSMPTSQAVDRVAAAEGFACYETPTGWKFFGNLLDDGRITLCGEESAGTGSDHLREKDGIWAVLFWLNILARRQVSVEQILRDHWRRFGRDYYTRHDYEAIDEERARDLMTALRAKLERLPGRDLAGRRIERADDFSYLDPVDGSLTEQQGIRIVFEGRGRVVYRLSGTGTKGATLRLYIEDFEEDPSRHALNTQERLSDLISAAGEIAELAERSGRAAPSVIT